jgi:putative transcriptional regulator
MDESLAGRLLVATPLLTDPNFTRTVVVVIQHDADGALGVVLNRPSQEPVADHLPGLGDRVAEPSVVFVGGPVEPEVGIGFERSDSSDRPLPVPGVGMLDLVAPEAYGPECRVFSGYAGWAPHQLEAELGEDAWLVVPGIADDVFCPEPDRLWSQVLRRQGGRHALLSWYPPNPELN